MRTKHVRILSIHVLHIEMIVKKFQW